MFKSCAYILMGVYFLASASCSFAGDRDYWGKVIDAGTKEPLEGAVVVAIWLEARATVSGESTRLKDVKETLTDKNGKWSITGPSGREGSNPILLLTFLTGMHYTRKPEFIIFKPGYCSWPKGFSIDACKERMKHSGAKEITDGGNVELPKLEKRERMTVIRNIPFLGMASGEEKKLPLYKKLVDQEEKEIWR
jgi:hypothetical protein